ncbi:NADH-quinone oxidoreductase subunit C [Paracoccus sp. (in: a-proteobacteria)]|uniref:NADH-quinone oxidoreductase subunit C n=1 Tax=Paracoccus sp. TaxID=267 RepID=UPI0026E0ED28|nr:NADH-quinone oxidoreductase subunit C [Paracoccus sp. (in: a-proteobacteria)]MDO5648147.1 NADH-quinone oxidoreductase subunit C [Paracoccus sp. (in: a-proteobacteria)]
MSVYPDHDALRQLADHIQARRPDNVVDTTLAYGELTVTATASGILDLIEFLRSDSNCRFSTLVDITAVDHPGRAQRFDVVWHFLSMYQNQRIRVKVAIREDEMLPSLTGTHPAANWFEREVFDMFGILFTGHPDMRRILTDYGFAGHPLRKDFPTTGYVEVRYSETERRVVYEPVNLVQEYRQFDFLSPWEGAKYVLPGDEKGEAK